MHEKQRRLLPHLGGQHVRIGPITYPYESLNSRIPRPTLHAETLTRTGPPVSPLGSLFVGIGFVAHLQWVSFAVCGPMLALPRARLWNTFRYSQCWLVVVRCRVSVAI